MNSDVASVRWSELMSAISLATDIGMAQPLETGLGVCLLASALADRLGLDAGERQRTYHLSLLQHIGCTATSYQVATVLGDELLMRTHTHTLDFADRRQMTGFLFAHVARANPPLGRPVALARALLLGGRVTAATVDACEAAVMLGRRCGYDEASLDDLTCVLEYWDGKGFPGAVRGEEIPAPVRVVQVATLAVAAHHAAGVDGAIDLVRNRRAHSLAPAEADAFLADPQGLLKPLHGAKSLWDAAIAAEPMPARVATENEIDEVLRAVADFVDLLAPSLTNHSSGVARLAAAGAQVLGLPAHEVSTVRRAGWLHDVGRIGVSAGVWEKTGQLTAHQWEQVRLHPYYTDRVLDRTPFLRQLAAVASAHHERADGSGYYRGVRGTQVTVAARVLAAADAYHSMTEPRPYRGALHSKVAAKELRNDVDAGRLDARAVDAVLHAAGEAQGRRPAAPAGLTAREVDILRQVVRGLSIKQIARALTIAPKTVDGHLQRIYAKVGVSTRAGATLFAIQHDLVSIEGQNGENSP